ncbi:hypothetical protein E2C01_004712 [Portunus trituberculatus]|uniref:Uncharacterized protein n=1 Tax=Portunus trituberculatus TaxID=210409 RepID=A0A5B7CS38_PORTR|nr:hypothetical protein [Portunus trituberculatus]
MSTGNKRHFQDDTHSSTAQHKHHDPLSPFPTSACCLQGVAVAMLAVVEEEEEESNDAAQQRVLVWRPPIPEFSSGAVERESCQEVSAGTRDGSKEPG